MSSMSMGKKVRYARTFGHLLELILFIFILVLVALYFFSIALGLELFLFEKLSDTFTPDYPIQIRFFSIQTKVSLGYIFISFVIIYVLCFALSWQKRTSFYKTIKGFRSRSLSLSMRNFLFALPVLSSLTYVAVVAIHLIEQFYGLPVGKPPLPEDVLLSFYGLTVSPLTEEVTYRILPIGVFLMVRLLTLAKKKSVSLKECLRICFLSFVSPEDAKNMIGLKTIARSGLKGGINRDEWVMVLFTSAFFALSHYLFSGTWLVGKIASSFIQGLVMSLSFLVYGFQAPILLHWFFNYYLYTVNLAAVVHPALVGLRFLNEESTRVLGVLGLLTITYLGIRKLIQVKTLTLGALLFSARKIKNRFSARGEELLSRVRQLEIYDLAALIFVLMVFSVRLVIVNSPAPESGDRYYDTGFIFDESYYVQAARKMLVGEASNNEHPPLSKGFIALGIILFGDNPLGWRIFSIVAATLSIALVYKVTFLLCKNKFASFFASFLFATDIMAFNIGQIAILDGPSMMFILLGSTFLLQKRYDLTGLSFGLASLCKLNAVFAAVGIVLFQVLSSSTGRKRNLKFLTEQISLAGRIAFIAFVTFLVGLWIYDAGYGVFGNNPMGHLIFMYNYHNSLHYQNVEEVVLPFQWINPLNPFSPIPYHVVTVREILNGIIQEYHPIAYYGIYTPLWWSVWIVVPMSLVETLRKARRNGGQGAGFFSLLWIAANFLPLVLLAYLMQRWVYPFYFYMSLPGLYIALSHYLAYSKHSRILLALLTVTNLLWFIVWFPVKPKPVIDLLLQLGLPA